MLLLMFFRLTSAFIFNPLFNSSQIPDFSCSKFSCLPQTTVTDFRSICLIYNAIESSYQSLACNNYFLIDNFCDTTILDPTLNQTIHCTEPQMNYTNLYPGESPCYSDSNCVSGVCENSVCVGAGFGIACNYTYECQQELGCIGTVFENDTVEDPGQCLPLLKPNHGNCISDFDCVNNAGCDYSFNNSYGTCKTYFSVPVGGQIEKCENYNSLICEYVQCSNSDDGKSYCVQPFFSKSEEPVSCITGKECVDSTNNYYSECSCGMNKNGISYCQLFLGNSISKNLLSTLKLWVNSYTILSCSTNRRWDLTCMKNWTPSLYDQIKYHLLAYSNFTIVQDNEECTKDVFTFQYWDAFKDFNYTSIGFIFYLGISIILIV